MAVPETTRFIQSFRRTPESVTSTLKKVLKEELPRTDPIDAAVIFDKMEQNLNNQEIEKAIPPWMSREGVFSIASELSSESFWELLLQEADLDTSRNVGRETSLAYPGRKIATNNALFVTSAIVLGLLGAAVGTAVDHCSHPSNVSKLKTAYASEIGERYPEPPADTDEYMQRVLELVPNPDAVKPNGKESLFHYLVKHDAFEGPRTKKDCPAVFFTRLLLDQWGRQLHTDEVYRERFKKTITKSSL